MVVAGNVLDGNTQEGCMFMDKKCGILEFRYAGILAAIHHGDQPKPDYAD
jgi:hypothetical protein